MKLCSIPNTTRGYPLLHYALVLWKILSLLPSEYQAVCCTYCFLCSEYRARCCSYRLLPSEYQAGCCTYCLLPSEYQACCCTHCLLSSEYRPAVGPTHFPIQRVPGSLYLRVKQPSFESDQSSPANAKPKNSLSNTSPLPHVFVMRFLITIGTTLPFLLSKTNFFFVHKDG
jgi:hypothetical protein